MASIFSSPPKPKGPSPEQLALQKKQADALDRKEREEKNKKRSRARVVSSLRGTRGLGTLFNNDERGVKLGGQSKKAQA